jgi:hypothetical protein
MTNELRIGLPTSNERRAAGRVLRDKTKRAQLGHWRPKGDRSDQLISSKRRTLDAWSGWFPSESAGCWHHPMLFSGVPLL